MKQREKEMWLVQEELWFEPPFDNRKPDSWLR